MKMVSFQAEKLLSANKVLHYRCKMTYLNSKVLPRIRRGFRRGKTVCFSPEKLFKAKRVLHQKQSRPNEHNSGRQFLPI